MGPKLASGKIEVGVLTREDPLPAVLDVNGHEVNVVEAPKFM